MAGGILSFSEMLYDDTMWTLCSWMKNSEVRDHYVVAVIKGDVIVGHVPWEISKTCYHFIAHDGEISCNRQQTALNTAWRRIRDTVWEEKLVLQRMNFIIVWTLLS